MNTFADLVFHDVEPSTWRLKRAHYKFQNGLGISVITGPGVSFCTNDTHQYTAAMLDENGEYVPQIDTS